MLDKVDEQTAPTTAMNKSNLGIIAANKPVISVYVPSTLHNRSSLATFVEFLFLWNKLYSRV